jgi:hypothetical protein
MKLSESQYMTEEQQNDVPATGPKSPHVCLSNLRRTSDLWIVFYEIYLSFFALIEFFKREYIVGELKCRKLLKLWWH